MRLAAFFDAIAPYLEGRIDHPEVVGRLYGSPHASDAAIALDAERLAIYGRFCRIHRLEALTVHGETRAAIVAQGGEPAWERLVEDFFRAHPMRHFELNENGAALSAWLAREASGRGLAPWLAEVADVEWWSWRAENHPDDPRDDEPGRGPLRITAPVELRPYRHDVLSWLDGDGARPAAPAARETVVLFWRDRQLDGRRDAARREELLVLKMVSERIDPGALLAATGMSRSALAATAEDLHAAGILAGDLAPLLTSSA